MVSIAVSKTAGQGSNPCARADSRIMKVVNYIKESYNEFKDFVTWPSWASLQQDTIVVAIVTVILALFLYGVDSLFGNVVIKTIFDLLK